MSKATHKYESAIRKVDVKLSVRGGDRGLGPKEHLAEVTIFTLRNGVVRATSHGVTTANSMISSCLEPRIKIFVEQSIKAACLLADTGCHSTTRARGFGSC